MRASSGGLAGRKPARKSGGSGPCYVLTAFATLVVGACRWWPASHASGGAGRVRSCGALGQACASGLASGHAGQGHSWACTGPAGPSPAAALDTTAPRTLPRAPPARPAAGLLIFYYYLFHGLRSYRETHPESGPAKVVDRLEAATSSLKRYLSTGADKGGAAASAAVGGTGPVIPAAACANDNGERCGRDFRGRRRDALETSRTTSVCIPLARCPPRTLQTPTRTWTWSMSASTSPRLCPATLRRSTASSHLVRGSAVVAAAREAAAGPAEKWGWGGSALSRWALRLTPSGLPVRRTRCCPFICVLRSHFSSYMSS